jgi:hypothetical protein
MQTIEQFIESRVSRSIKMQDRTLARLDRREAAAEQQVGTLIRDGKQINYVMPQGGKYREGSKSDLVAFLLRNNYA